MTQSRLPLLTALACFLVLNAVGFAPAADKKNDKSAPIAIAEVKHKGPVNFEKEILPILTKNCLACHSATKAENGLVLETPQTIVKGGDSGPAVVAKKPDESLLLKVAAHLDEPIMPPVDNKVGAGALKPEELGLVKLWINEGATGEVSAQAVQVKWQPLPPGVNPIYAVAITPDGQFAACGRANQIFVYHVPTGQTVTRLTDPALLKSGLYASFGVAHLDLVQSLAFNPAGDLLASGSYREVKLWRRPSSVHKADLAGLPEAVKVSATSPDGKLIATGSANGAIKLWDAATGKEAKNLAGHTAAVTGLRFLPAGDKLISSGADKAIIVWNLADGAQASKLEAPAAVNALAVLGDGATVATADADNVLRVWTLADGMSKELAKVTSPVTALESSRTDKSVLFSALADGNIVHWNADTGKETRRLNHGGAVTAISLRPDGQQLASAGANNLVKLWNVQRGNAWTFANNQAVPEMKGDQNAQLQVEKIERSVVGVTKKIADKKKDLTDAEAKVKSSEEAVKTATTSKENAAKALAEKTAAAKAPTEAKAAADKELEVAMAESKTAAEKAAAAKEAFAKDDKNADLDKANKDAAKAAEDAQNKVKAAEKKVQDAAAPAAKATQEAATAEAGNMAAEQALMAAMTAAKKAVDAVPVAQAAVKAVEEQLAKSQADLAAAKTAATAQEKPILALAYSADGAQLASGGDNQLVRTWVSETGAPVSTYEGHKAPVTAVAFAGANVLSAAADKSGVLWDSAPAWKLERTIGSFESASMFVDRVVALAFSPDGKLLATGGGEPSRSGELKIFNVADGKLARAIADAHSDTVFGVEFSPEGQHLASAAADRFMKVFEVATGSRIRSYEGHTHHVLDVGWRADGKVLATGGADNVIKVWDFASGEQLRTTQPLPKEVTSVSFVADTPTFIVSCGDKTVRLYNTDNGQNARTYNGGNDFMYATAVTANGKVTIGGGQDSILQVWDVDKGSVLRSLEPPKTSEETAQK